MFGGELQEGSFAIFAGAAIDIDYAQSTRTDGEANVAIWIGCPECPNSVDIAGCTVKSLRRFERGMLSG